ncbi:MAG: S8 family serine peptidase [Anaerolineae bacterium]
MNSRILWRWCSLSLVLMLALSLVAPAAAAPEPQPLPPDARSAVQAAPAQPTVSPEEALRKLHADLRETARTASPALPAGAGPQAAAPSEPVLIEVFAAKGADLSRYFVDGKVIARPPLSKGEKTIQIFIGFVYPYNLMKLASLAQVEYIYPVVLERNAEPDPYPADQPRQTVKKGPEDWAKLRENAAKLREGVLPWDQAKAFGDGRPDIRPQDWFEVMPTGPHQAQDAWARGYRGEGVTVAVLDDGIDHAHPDLLGTQKIYSSTLAPQYNGWPYVFSPLSMLLYAFDNVFGTTYVADGYPGIHYVDTSARPKLTPCGPGISCFKYTPLIDYGVRGYEHTYVIANSMTKSGVVHVGTHPDNDLRDFLWGEKVAVLVTDPNVAGVYDTVYVDLNDDYDFRDEKPLTRADVNNPATYNNMIAYRDFNGDGKADISGGALYFIADGVTPIPASDWIYGPFAPPPGNGDLVAFSGSTFDRDYSHGTQCASNIVGQGRTNAMLPDFSDLAATLYGRTSTAGKPAGAVFGMAPGAKVVNISDIYYNFDASTIDAYIFAAVGYDACDQTGFDLLTGGACDDSDAIQITTNSYGSSAQDNDGWDYHGQVVSQLQRWWAPNLQFLFSTGNGAPAYGTVAPPLPATGIAVGASTEFGSTGWDSITSTTQIMNNDVIPFSNRGPSARGTNGVDVVAGGAYAAGAEELNYYSVSTWGVLDGNRSWVSWGGTSRSAPVAGGVLALIYQAYKQANGVWPTHDVARALLMSSATDLNYDTLSQGAGSVNADRGTAVAGGHYGVFAMPAEWNPGGFRGNNWPGFAHIVRPGDVQTQTITVVNPAAPPVALNAAPAQVNVTMSDAELKLIKAEEFNFTVTPAMVAAESAYGSANRDNFYKAFNFFIPITATAGMDPSWYKVPIPAGTDLMIVRQIYPYSQFDVNGDYTWDQRFYLTVYNWQDMNGNGKVWDDKDGNGVVNFINDPTTFGQQADGALELKWSDPRTELDRWEYGRFGYNRPGGNSYEMWVHDPLTRMKDGLFIGVRHLYNARAVNITTTLSYRIEFYKKQDVPWLTLSATNLAVPDGGAANFVATVNVPNDMPPGIYQAGIYIADPGNATYEPNTIVIPVVLNVAAPFTAGTTLGGERSATYDAGRPYNNGVVRGFFDWTWRAESGDWRFFFTDVPNSVPVTGTKILVKDEWADAAPHTDIDTIVLGPTPTSLGDGWYDWPEPGFYGPYVLDTVAKSPNTNVSAGIWRFNTSSGTNEDWVAAPLQNGLHAFLQHNVLYEGDKFDVVFTKTIGTLVEDVSTFTLDTYVDAGVVGTVTVTSTLPLNGLQAAGFLIAPQIKQFVNQPLSFTGAGTIEWTYPFTLTSAYYVDIRTSSADIADLDLLLYRWTGTAWQQVASSAGADANERIRLNQPADGRYLVAIDNYSGPAGHFNLTIDVGVNVGGVAVTGTPSGPVPANTPVALGISYNYAMQANTCYDGLILLGPPEAPALKQIPLRICRKPSSAGIEKTVNLPTAFAGNELKYTINLFNYNDPAATFAFSDPIPAGTEFVAVTNATYDAANNRVVYNGVLPLGAIPPVQEGFEGGVVPPPGWTVQAQNAAKTWAISTNYVHTGNFGAYVPWDYNQDEWLLSPRLLGVTGGVTTSLWSMGSVTWCRTTNNCDLNVWLVVNAVGGGDDVLLGKADNDWTANWTWARSVFTLPTTLPAGDLRIGYQYVGDDGADVGLDDIVLPGTPAALPSRVVQLTVRVTDTVTAGSRITNTATLRATHALPQGTQQEPAVQASAVTHIGVENFATSYKEAPAVATSGTEFVYAIHVINSGDKLAAVTLTDPLPNGVSYVEHWSDPPSAYYAYDPAANRVEWGGNMGPGDKRVFYVKVKAGTAAALWGTTITNTATIAWDGNTMALVSQPTLIVPPYKLFLPLIQR